MINRDFFKNVVIFLAIISIAWSTFFIVDAYTQDNPDSPDAGVIRGILDTGILGR